MTNKEIKYLKEIIENKNIKDLEKYISEKEIANIEKNIKIHDKKEKQRKDEMELEKSKNELWNYIDEFLITIIDKYYRNEKLREYLINKYDNTTLNVLNDFYEDGAK